jgi:hypothetical protein
VKELLLGKGLNLPLQLLARHQQKLKWTVYTLLILNFGYYIFDDWRAAQSVLLPDASFLDITASYATSFDELGWFGLLFLFEFETYWADDEVDYGLGYWLMQGFMVLCYVVLSHTLYAYVMDIIDLGKATVLSDVDTVCALVGQELSFLRNLAYDLIDAGNCATLSEGGAIYRLDGEPVVTDITGYQLDLRQAWMTLIECVGWLSIVLLITFVMLLQNAGVYESRWIRSANTLQYVAYACIIACALSWSWYGYYVYTWDSLLWIGGFAAIDANLSSWRDELKDKQVAATGVANSSH